MNRNIVAGIIALILVVGCGIAEVFIIDDGYRKLAAECDTVLAACRGQTLSEEEYEAFAEHWIELRETSELLLPHLDVYELNLRVAEARSYVQQEDFASAHAQLSVVRELLRYIPHLTVPSIKHII